MSAISWSVMWCGISRRFWKASSCWLAECIRACNRQLLSLLWIRPICTIEWSELSICINLLSIRYWLQKRFAECVDWVASMRFSVSTTYLLCVVCCKWFEILLLAFAESSISAASSIFHSGCGSDWRCVVTIFWWGVKLKCGDPFDSLRNLPQ